MPFIYLPITGLDYYLEAEILSQIYVGGEPTEYWISITIFIKQFLKVFGLTQQSLLKQNNLNAVGVLRSSVRPP